MNESRMENTKQRRERLQWWINRYALQKPRTARTFHGSCQICLNAIHPGDSVKGRAIGLYAHVDCINEVSKMLREIEKKAGDSK